MKVLYITFFLVLADQVTKLLIKGIKVDFFGLVVEGMPYGSSRPLIGDIIKLTFIENPGMAFGIDIGPKMFLTLFTIVASVFIFLYIYKHRNDSLLLRIPLALILAGAIGNLIDRTFYGVIYGYAPLFHGKVVDFIQVEFWDFTVLGRTYTTWPIFNIADVAVSLGFLTIIIFHNKIFKNKSKDSELIDGTENDLGSDGFHDSENRSESDYNNEAVRQTEFTSSSNKGEDTEKNAHDSSPGTV